MGKLTIATMLSGGGLVEIGAKAAGFTPIHAIELVPEIAEVYRVNHGDHITVGDICAQDYSALPVPYLRHASPQCIHASNANTGADEDEQDIAQARAVVACLKAQRSPVFTLENVGGYADFESFRIILETLYQLGYAVRWWLLNSADYGVPQTRKRLILVASREFTPRRPEATHTDPRKIGAQTSMFGLAPWNGWYAAIEDLIPTLPDSQFAPWQLERLPEALRESFLIGDGNTNVENPIRDGGEPVRAITKESGGRVRAFLVHGADMRSMPVARGDEPAFTVLANGGGNANKPRAWLVSNDESADQYGNGYGVVSVRKDTEPSLTVKASSSPTRLRALLAAGRTVSMTPRALARFQSVPDSYQLPERAGLACKVNGNGVPPELYAAVLRAQPMGVAA